MGAPAKRRFRWLAGAVVAAGIAAASAVYFWGDGRNQVPAQIDEDFRAPSATPLVEPDRPDLLGEPRIEDDEP